VSWFVGLPLAMVGGALFVIFNRPIAKLMCDMSPFLDDGWIAHSRRDVS
jgi:hypothetical protein